MKTAYIGIGSNLGDPYENCMKAVEAVKENPFCTVKALSPFYRTEPVGVEGQNWFVNVVLAVNTSLSSAELIEVLLDIEKKMGRTRSGIRWESRVIDLDILLFGNEIINDKNLTVPHPRMHVRRFVMAPMADIAPELIHPVKGKSMADLLQEIPSDEQEVRLMEKN
ncbi:MAG: 2-amino-4-hydroxy-6-hydroxymethyldihydropteridine diphosphokinase [Deltaproteobacteria bacterium]|nr:2-amino-4-hydroxy-6-hydroxymethyldihydropteridine diphosphokinase [Deltaproteobacteria bacterium]